MPEPLNIEPRKIRRRGGYQRCIIYVGVMAIVVPVASLLFYSLGLAEREQLFPVIIALEFLCLMIGLPMKLIAPHLRIDNAGIWHKPFFRWRLWAWPDPAASREERRRRYKKLPKLGALMYASQEDVEWFNTVFKTMLPDFGKIAADASDHVKMALHLKPSLLSRSELTLDSHGVSGKWFRKQYCFSWQDVDQVYLRQRAPGDSRPELLKITTKDVELSLIRDQNSAQYLRGAKPKELVGYLKRHVPADRFFEVNIQCQANTPEQAQEKLRYLKRAERSTRYLTLFTGVALLVFMVPWRQAAKLIRELAYSSWQDTAVSALMLLVPVIGALLFTAIPWLSYKQLCQNRKAAEEEYRELLAREVDDGDVTNGTT